MESFSQARAGDELGGYRLLRPLGHGGAGVVWEVEDEGGHRFALKKLHPAIAADPVSRQRLAREASTLNRIRDDGVAQVVDLETEGSVPFVVTELIDGVSLREDLQLHGPMRFSQALEMLASLGSTLEAVHERGVIHRDIKPSNIVLGPDGPVLIDFGIAQTEDDERLTSTGLVSGTAGWVAPEVLSGALPSRSSDYWSLVAVFLTMLTGRQPFGTGGAEAVLGRVWMNRPDTEGIHPELAAHIRQALAPQDQRMTFGEFVRALEVAEPVVFDQWDAQVTQPLTSANGENFRTQSFSHDPADDATALLDGGDASVTRRSVFDADETTVQPTGQYPPHNGADRWSDSGVEATAHLGALSSRASWQEVATPSPYPYDSVSVAYPHPESMAPYPMAVPEPYGYSKPPSAVMLSFGGACVLALLPLLLGVGGVIVTIGLLLVLETIGYARTWRERRRIEFGGVRSSDNSWAAVRSIGYIFQAALGISLNLGIATLLIMAGWVLWGLNNEVTDWRANLYSQMLSSGAGVRPEALGASVLVIAGALWASNLGAIMVTRMGPGGWHLREGTRAVVSTLIPSAFARPLIGVVLTVSAALALFAVFGG